MKPKKTAQAGRSRPKDEWIYGLNPVVEAVRSGRKIKSVFMAESRKKTFELENELSARGIKIEKRDNFFFDSRFRKGHQGIAAIVSQRKQAHFGDLLKLPAEKGETPLFLILDCIEDPRNLGAVLRVADAGGVHGVVMQSHRSASLGPEAVKASAGASEYIPVATVPNIKHAIKDMKDKGFLIIGAEAGMDKSFWDLDLRGPLAVVLGSEGRGLRKTVKENCDILASFPMKGRINSLNISVAAGAVIFEIIRQRNG